MRRHYWWFLSVIFFNMHIEYVVCYRVHTWWTTPVVRLLTALPSRRRARAATSAVRISRQLFTRTVRTEQFAIKCGVWICPRRAMEIGIMVHRQGCIHFVLQNCLGRCLWECNLCLLCFVSKRYFVIYLSGKWNKMAEFHLSIRRRGLPTSQWHLLHSWPCAFHSPPLPAFLTGIFYICCRLQWWCLEPATRPSRPPMAHNEEPGHDPPHIWHHPWRPGGSQKPDKYPVLQLLIIIGYKVSQPLQCNHVEQNIVCDHDDGL